MRPPHGGAPGGRRKFVFVVNSDHFFVSHRLALGEALVARGHEVVLAAGATGGRAEAERAGIRVETVPFDRGGRSPVNDAVTCARLLALYRRERPSLVHHVTIKPVLYGSIAARAAGVGAVVNAVSGLGFVFIERPGDPPSARLLRAGVRAGYRLALGGKNVRTVFQNPDDRRVFVEGGLVDASRTLCVHGSGVDTGRFRPSPLPDGDAPLVVLPARVLFDKGVGEFVEAARRLRAAGSRARFVLVGDVDRANPARVDPVTLAEWVAEGVVEHWGHRTDMPAVFASSTLVVLPSYREGMPLALAEAAASGRACVATDVPGCREIVRHGDNGWLVPARDANALATAIGDSLADRKELARRAARGPAVVAEGFTREAILAAHVALYDQLLRSAAPGHDGDLVG